MCDKTGGDGVSLNSMAHPTTRKLSLWYRLREFLFGPSFHKGSIETAEIEHHQSPRGLHPRRQLKPIETPDDWGDAR